MGKSNYKLVQGRNQLGVDLSDENAQDDIVVREVHLIKDEPVLLKFRSKDVIHSAYLPHFRVQMNCVPGMTTQFAFTPTKTTSEMREIVHALYAVAADVSFVEIQTDKGHDSFLLDEPELHMT